VGEATAEQNPLSHLLERFFGETVNSALGIDVDDCFEATTTAMKTASTRVKVMNDDATAALAAPLRVAIQLHQVGCNVAKKPSKSTETQRHTATTTMERALPIMVRFFQSDDSVDAVILAPRLSEARR
jgi:hypothetical protein